MQCDDKKYFPLQVPTRKVNLLNICGEPVALELKHNGLSGRGAHIGFITAVRYIGTDPCDLNYFEDTFKEEEGLALVNCELQTDRHGNKWFNSKEVRYDHGSRLGLTWEYPDYSCPSSCI